MSTRERLEVAEALIAKARSTPFGSERATFAAGAYRQLARYLGTADPAEAVVPPLCIDLRDGDGPAVEDAMPPAQETYQATAAGGRRTVGARVDLAL